MPKKKETKSTKAKRADASKPTRRSAHAEAPAAAAEAAQGAAPEATTPAAPRERVRDPRLPPPGTVIEKRDRKNAVRCTCTVEEDGAIRCQGKLYKSLSAAALAAARDLGIEGKAFNGYVWWGLSKPPRPAVDPVEALGRTWERYRERANAVVDAVKDDDRQRVHELLGEHAEAIKDLRGKVA